MPAGAVLRRELKLRFGARCGVARIYRMLAVKRRRCFRDDGQFTGSLNTPSLQKSHPYLQKLCKFLVLRQSMRRYLRRRV
jgi:hypothetical protein